MSRNALIALGIGAVIVVASAIWLSQDPFSQSTYAPETVLEASEDQSEALFADSMEDVLEEDVEVTVESDIDEDSEIRFENDPDEDE